MSQEEEREDSSLCSVPDYLRVCYDPVSSYDDVLKENKKREAAAMAASSPPEPKNNNGRWFYQCSPSGTYTSIPHALDSLKKEFELESKEEVKRYLCPPSINPNNSCSDFSYGEGKWQCIPPEYEERMSVLNPYFLDSVVEDSKDKTIITSPHSSPSWDNKNNNNNNGNTFWQRMYTLFYLNDIELSSFIISALFTMLLSGIVLFFILSLLFVK